MQQFSHPHKQSLARVFALLALLCAGVLQAQEASHDHWHSLDDSYAQCLLCKSTAAAPVPAVSVAGIQAAGSPTAVECPLAIAAEPRLAFSARGPPVLS